MTPTPPGVSDRAWRAVLAEDIPPPGTEGRDHVGTHDRREDSQSPRHRPDRDDVADAMRCAENGCGSAMQGGGAPRGWVLVRIVGSGDPPRRYCSGSCASKGIAHVELGHHRLDRPEPDATVTPIRSAPASLPPGRQRATSVVRASSDQQWRQLLAALGKAASDVRAWCSQHEVACPNRGPIAATAREAYARAHTTEGATA